MDIAEALEIVINLARQNIPSDPELEELAARYAEACNVVEDMAVNQFSED
jgi:hypothetical protein